MSTYDRSPAEARPLFFLGSSLLSKGRFSFPLVIMIVATPKFIDGIVFPVGVASGIGLFMREVYFFESLNTAGILKIFQHILISCQFFFRHTKKDTIF